MDYLLREEVRGKKYEVLSIKYEGREYLAFY